MDQLHFEKLIVDVLRKNLAATAASPASPSTAVAMAFANAIVYPMTTPQAFPKPPAILDRSPNMGLLSYAWVRAIEIRRMPIEANGNSWCSAVEAMDQSDWGELALNIAAHRCKRKDWLARSSAFFQRVIQQQQTGGALFPQNSTVNPEVRWYDELVRLHALSTYAIQNRSRSAQLAVERATDFHLMETEPDHATREPWAIYAFYSNPRTRIQAEQILHGAVMQNPESASPATLILLTDALWCLRSMGCGAGQVER